MGMIQENERAACLQSGMPRLDMSALMQMQFNYECGAEHAHPRGHTSKLLSLLSLAILRHLLWTKTQIPQPLQALERDFFALMNEDVDASCLCLSYSTDMSVLPPLTMARHLPGPAQRVTQLLYSCTKLETRLYELLASLESAPPTTLHMAMVTGQSLSFPQHVLVLHFDRMLAFGENSLPDSDTCKARRRKVSALMERKFVRFTMDKDLLSPDICKPTRTRILVCAPTQLQISGWYPRPHWHAPAPTYLPDPEPESETEDLLAHAPELRVSKMNQDTHAFLSRHSARKQTYTRRIRCKTRSVHLGVDGGLRPTHGIPPPCVTWYECDAHVVGF